MREALEAVGEFLSKCGALESANAISEMLEKMGVRLPADSPLRWRSLVAAIRQELDDEPMDAVFLFERLVQLFATMPGGLRKALFGSPLFLHLVVERFAVAFEGLDAELFKLESDELCHAEGIYELCLLIRDNMESNEAPSELSTFLATFAKIFDQDEPKDCWDTLYDMFHLNDVCFRRDMKRALCLIEATALGPTQIELAFPSKAPSGPKKLVPRVLLSKKFGGTQREWEDLSVINSIAGVDRIRREGAAAHGSRERERRRQLTSNGDATTGTRGRELDGSSATWDWIWSTRVPFSLNGESSDSARSDAGEAAPASSRPPRIETGARAARQESRRSTRPDSGTDPNVAAEPGSTGARRAGKRKRRTLWSQEEVAALQDGFKLFGSYPNVWVLTKAKYAHVLRNRSNVDLKDKYRNLLKYGKIPPPAEGDGAA